MSPSSFHFWHDNLQQTHSSAKLIKMNNHLIMVSPMGIQKWKWPSGHRTNEQRFIQGYLLKLNEFVIFEPRSTPSLPTPSSVRQEYHYRLVQPRTQTSNVPQFPAGGLSSTSQLEDITVEKIKDGSVRGGPEASS